MRSLMDIARHVVARNTGSESVNSTADAGEKGDKGEKTTASGPFSPLSPFSPAAGNTNSVALSGTEPWNIRVALELTAEADALVRHLGVDGTHPAAQEAAAVVTSALTTRDLETVRFAVSEFVVCVRRVAARNPGGGGTIPCGRERDNASFVRPAQQPNIDGTHCWRGS